MVEGSGGVTEKASETGNLAMSSLRAVAFWKAILVGLCFVAVRGAAAADKAAPLRMQSYIDRNYYTAEKSIRACVRLEGKSEQPLTAELEIRYSPTGFLSALVLSSSKRTILSEILETTILRSRWACRPVPVT